EGCNRSCSFCTIPSFRGKQRSRSIADLVRETEQLVARGVVEVCLISQDTIAYGRDLEERPTLAQLASALAEVDGLRWVRLHYLYPESLTKELVDVLAHHPKVLPYIDMPLQHAATNMLRRMKRGHGGKRLYELVDKLRKNVPDLVFRSSFIVGHPGETEEEFQELLDFVTWAEFDHLGVFLYSPEENTPSGTMSGEVPEKIAKARHRKLMRAQRPISRAKLKARIGTEIEVLVDGVSDEHEFLLEGRWWGQAPEVDGKIYLANGDAAPGEIRKALVTAAADYDLVADLLTPEGEWLAPPGTRRPRKRKVQLRTLA
ncbi:MAG: MiaB/RimO family radical SAM methylthiotransferase, partial [Myxococcales bacterium]|nr:MiaB/RimO family radical SAM methylthiotransferase [Myxococcales bacterium]